MPTSKVSVVLRSRFGPRGSNAAALLVYKDVQSLSACPGWSPSMFRTDPQLPTVHAQIVKSASVDQYTYSAVPFSRVVCAGVAAVLFLTLLSVLTYLAWSSANLHFE
ncbi:unnamed protein product [Heligmosomoides polygyrus]|uniref:Uncharacterized protein n=1 Tax=Heligmosomoides polygyrus TaxID=6339 RepID=A0A183FP38_HELPZ|nr:unnamed protein product [Heligmosomoides polygyrus]